MLAVRLMSLAAAGALVAALAGCASSGDNDADSDIDSDQLTGEIACGLSNGKEATGAPIKVGAISTESGGIDFSSSSKAAQAYFDCVNANGGINGRPIDYDRQDDGLDPQKASALATKFAGDTDVVAMAGGASFIACGINQPIYEKGNLFDILGVGVPQPCFYSKNMSALNAGPRLSMISAVQQQVEENGVTSAAGSGYTIPGLGDWVKEGLEAYGDEQGVDISYFDLVPPPVEDATSLVTELRSKKPGTFALGWAAADNATYLKAVEQQGLDESTTVTCLTPCYDTTFPAQIGSFWNDKLWSNSEFSMLDSEGEDNLNWRRVLKDFGTADQPRDSFSQGGYLAARVLVDALLGLEPDAISRETVSEAIQGIKGFETDMLCQAWYFAGPNGHNNANHQLLNVKLGADGEFEKANDCFETQDPGLADIIAFEESNPDVLTGS